MRLALAGDTMLGRLVADRLAHSPPNSLFSPAVLEATAGADLFVLNLECCISSRGEPWPDSRKPFFFRAPPVAVEVLHALGVDAVTLANNHALDYGFEALEDTLDLLEEGAIAVVGAGHDLEEARRPALLEHQGFRVGVVGVTDHPQDFAAGPDRPGVAFADLWESSVPQWVVDLVDSLPVDAVLVTPHWGPNMTASPVAHVRRSAQQLTDARATIVAGHSAHTFHGVEGSVLFDLGDFIDDYAVDPVMRNDLGLLWFVDLDVSGARRIEALPLALDFCYTRLAGPEEMEWISARLRRACAEFGTDVREEGGRLVIEPVTGPGPARPM